MTSDSRRQRSPRGQGGRVRDELLDAADRLLAERGEASAVTVADIVREVGVTPPVLYAHFADKDELFVAVHARHMVDFRDALRRATRQATSPLDQLERRGRAYIRYALTHQDRYAALFMRAEPLASQKFTDPEMRRLSAFDDLVDNIQACVDAGEVPELDPEVAARLVWCQVHGLASLLITVPEMAVDVGRQRLITAVMHSVTAALVSGSAAR